MPCMVSFVLLYYFTMAASMWWVVLCVTWYLGAGLTWGDEAIAGKPTTRVKATH